MTGLLDDLVEARFPWVSEVLRGWYDETELRAQLRHALAPEAERCENAAFGRGLRDAVGIDGIDDPLDWANRRLGLATGGWALTGIRFRGLDVTRPFVDVVATTEAPTPDGLAVVAAAVVPAYAAFRPRCLRVDAPYAGSLVEQLLEDPRFGPACAVDQHVVAGPVERLRRTRRSGVGVRLVPGEPRRLAVRAAEVYAGLAEVEPELSQWARAEDEDSLAACAEQGLLFEVLVDDEPAGVAAAVRLDDHGLRGFCVQELCLAAAHRGRRLAAPTLQLLVARLPSRPGDVLWGTIHPANAPSLRNALSVGRELVGGYVWVVPDGLPGMPATEAG